MIQVAMGWDDCLARRSPDPTHAEHADMLEWLGIASADELDPHAFDADDMNRRARLANRRDPRRRREIRRGRAVAGYDPVSPISQSSESGATRTSRIWRMARAIRRAAGYDAAPQWGGYGGS
jgi:hypothetical protein